MIAKQRVTLKQLSERLNISQNTVSLALRGRPGISEATRSAVFQAAEEMGYKFRKKIGRAACVCIVTPYAGGTLTYYFSRYQLEIETSLRLLGCTVFTINSAASGAVGILRDMCVNREVNGIVIAGDIGQPLIEQFQAMGIPMVCAGFYNPALELDCICEDDVSGIMLAVKELKGRRYTRFGFLGDIDDSGFFSRFMALNASLYKEGLVLTPGASLTQYSQDDLCNPEYLMELLRNLPEIPDIFICCNDKTALTVIYVLNRLGLRVPDDVGVLGFDNADLARISIPTLATIDNFPSVQAEIVAWRISKRINDPAIPPLRILTRVEFVPGGSIRSLNQ